MIGRCIITLPFNTGGLVSFRIKRKVGFAFNNQMMYNMMQKHPEFSNSFDKFSEYGKKNEQAFAIEMYYCAALAWCQENFKKPNFTEKSFYQAIVKSKDIKILSETWKASEFGSKELGGKKKADETAR